jgi:glycosyltransferase involved in cell wall biosynthesis
MSSYPLVSFLIAAYNEEKYISECVDSCLNQTYRNIEVCVTDDGTLDGTWSILKAKYENNSKVKLSKFSKNSGKVSAFNNSYTMSKGEYFALIGADDVNMLDRIETSLDFLHNNDLNFLFGDFECCDADLNILNLTHNNKLKKIKNNNFKVENILKSNFVSGGTVFFDKNIANFIFPIPEELQFEDWWIGFVAVSRCKVGYFQKKLNKYRYTGKNYFSPFYVDINKKMEILKKDFSRHFIYLDIFKKYIMSNEIFLYKNHLLKTIELSIIYRKIYIEDKIFNRLKYLSKILNNFNFSFYLFKIFLIMFFGAKNLLLLKKRFIDIFLKITRSPQK